MDLKLEIEGLTQVKNGLQDCCSSLENVKKEIAQEEQASTFWVGQGKNAYLEWLQPLRNQIENCSSRLWNSAEVLMRSLNQYVETENQIQADNRNLPAENIF